MLKKLIALVEALMLVSLFCIGFASWSIIDPDGITISTNGGIQTEGVQSASLETIGLKSASGATGFQYNLNGGTAAFSKTTLTIDAVFDKAALTALVYDEPYQLLFECTNSANAVDIFTDSTYLIAPTVATAYISGFPNQKIQGEITATQTKLSASFTIKSTSQASVYNLVSRATGDTVTLVFTFEFSIPSTTPPPDYVKAICWSTYNLSFRLGAL